MTLAEMDELAEAISDGHDKLLADIKADRLTQVEIDARLTELEAMKDRVRAAAYEKIGRH
jgi:uncharacterized protein YqgV (UPF0045/DUF77 family)